MSRQIKKCLQRGTDLGDVTAFVAFEPAMANGVGNRAQHHHDHQNDGHPVETGLEPEAQLDERTHQLTRIQVVEQPNGDPQEQDTDDGDASVGQGVDTAGHEQPGKEKNDQGVDELVHQDLRKLEVKRATVDAHLNIGVVVAAKQQVDPGNQDKCYHGQTPDGFFLTSCHGTPPCVRVLGRQ